MPYLFKQLQLFFLNQQFITQHTLADRGSYFVATYMRSRLTWNERDRESEREKKNNKRGENRKRN